MIKIRFHYYFSFRIIIPLPICDGFPLPSNVQVRILTKLCFYFSTSRRSSARQSESLYRYKEIVVKKCQGYTQVRLFTTTPTRNALNLKVSYVTFTVGLLLLSSKPLF